MDYKDFIYCLLSELRILVGFKQIMTILKWSIAFFPPKAINSTGIDERKTYNI